jgi:hypothetical protein
VKVVTVLDGLTAMMGSSSGAGAGAGAGAGVGGINITHAQGCDISINPINPVMLAAAVALHIQADATVLARCSFFVFDRIVQPPLESNHTTSTQGHMRDPITCLLGVHFLTGATTNRVTPLQVVGDSTANSAGFGSESCGETADTNGLDLYGQQMELLAALVGSNSTAKLIVVLVHGHPVTFGPGNALLEGVDALVSAWRPGEEGGTVLVFEL